MYEWNRFDYRFAYVYDYGNDCVYDYGFVIILITLMIIEKDRISSPWLKNDWVTFKIIKIFGF